MKISLILIMIIYSKNCISYEFYLDQVSVQLENKIDYHTYFTGRIAITSIKTKLKYYIKFESYLMKTYYEICRVFNSKPNGAAAFECPISKQSLLIYFK